MWRWASCATWVCRRATSRASCPWSGAEVGEKLRGESHAWVEWWSGSWQAWDPTNGRPAGPDHVLVARGRDYDDVPPLKGIYSGAGSGELFVTVELTRLA